MQCPVDNETLVMTERQGVEIDYCPKCRGVWLDRGELDKIIEKSAAAEARGPAPRAGYDERSRDERGREDSRSGSYGGHKPKKRESLLGEIFDIF
ncbi:TFIIB-type zinc ribbon-containing protein [Marinicauda sp. Alg238-R41]|uniref:TFIIB-type zinc ribbon-containing protein n=1 Tax=Marinicauda sp. Alg238-R41 TaxID=2993447 RepID=UPI0022DF6B81|nr:zf-TFIIB domain-containing protein [Marinicauda sp. Alg238-R41]